MTSGGSPTSGTASKSTRHLDVHCYHHPARRFEVAKMCQDMDITIQATQGANVHKPFVTSTISVLNSLIFPWRALLIKQTKPNHLFTIFLCCRTWAPSPWPWEPGGGTTTRRPWCSRSQTESRWNIHIIVNTHGFPFVLWKNKNKLCSMTCSRVPAKGTIENTLDYPFPFALWFQNEEGPPLLYKGIFVQVWGVPLQSEIIVLKERVVQR